MPARAPAVSVIVPTYQRRDMARRAVESVLGQDFADLEAIVVDDGSDDGTEEALAGLDDRLRYRWQPNAGVSAARNAGLRLARAPVVAFLDADDRWLPGHLATLMTLLARHPEAVLATTSPRRVIGGRAEVGDAWLFDPLPVCFFAISFGYPSCVAVRRDPVLAAGGFDERMPVHEAVDLFMKLGLHGPFAMLQRRTIVKDYTSGLKEWGRTRGHYLDAFEYRARRSIGELAGARGVRERELARQAEGALALATAMRALDRGDDEGVRAALADACHGAPQLSAEAEIVRERLEYMPLAHRPDDRLRHLETFARLWPDQGSDTARYLRLCAAGAAARHGRPREAARLLAGRPAVLTPGLARRSAPALARRARRRIDARRHPADDGVDLDSRPANAPAAPEPAAEPLPVPGAADDTPRG